MITLSSDFGTPYPAAMKGVILERTDARLVDIAHDFPRHDVRAAGFWLRFVLPEFPPAVHCAVVDPGVGTDRKVIVIRAGGHALVGPDNGSLLPPARALAGQKPSTDPDSTSAIDVFEYDVTDPDSATFHGRDVFAPLAARVHERGIANASNTANEAANTTSRNGGGFTPANEGDEAKAHTIQRGISFENLDSIDGLTPTDDFVDLTVPDPTIVRNDDVKNGPQSDSPGSSAIDSVVGEVLVVDGFGNAITNIPGDLLDRIERVEIGGQSVPVVETFGAVDPGDPLVTVGSHGYVECDVRDGSGAIAFGLESGERLELDVVRND